LGGGTNTFLPGSVVKPPKEKMEVIGWAGTILVIIAYYPQIRHLWVEKCAWGISIATWLIWLVASMLLLTYALMRRDTLFVIVQGINILAIVTTIILARRSNNVCSYHLKAAQIGATGDDEHLRVG
jgi:lipid-A-disaccharide synthase-like uncharacterized protein